MAHGALVPVSCVLEQQWRTAGFTVVHSKFAQESPHQVTSLPMTIVTMPPN